MPTPTLTLVRPGGLRDASATLSLQELCLPLGLRADDVAGLEQAVERRITCRRGTALYRAGEPFVSLFLVRFGFFKTAVTNTDGREQVTGFQMSGEMLGLDGIHADAHTCSAIALADSEALELPFARFEDLAVRLPALRRHLLKLLSGEIVRDQETMTMLGAMKAEERVIAFLLDLSRRFAARGWSALRFGLRMTREEIGTYLGLKVETVSRALTRLQEERLIRVSHRDVELLDPDRMHMLIGESPTPTRVPTERRRAAARV